MRRPGAWRSKPVVLVCLHGGQVGMRKRFTNERGANRYFAHHVERWCPCPQECVPQLHIEPLDDPAKAEGGCQPPRRHAASQRVRQHHHPNQPDPSRPDRGGSR